MHAPEFIINGNDYCGLGSATVFCEKYAEDLAAQGLGDCARDIIDADRAPDMYGEKAERATWAWEDILCRFRPGPGQHLEYKPESEELYAVPNGFNWDEWDCVKWRPRGEA